MSSKPFEFRPSGLIDFEPVDPAGAVKEAQAPRDDKPGGDPLSIDFGRAKGTKPTPAELMLAGSTIDWLLAFPPELRPKALCDRYPHVANRLAREWSDAARSAPSLRALAGDARWGSPGFPAQVQGELQRLLQQVGGAG